MDEKIDRARVKDPAEVSGWGPGPKKVDRQNYSDIAKKAEVKPEFEPGVGRVTLRGRCDGTREE